MDKEGSIDGSKAYIIRSYVIVNGEEKRREMD